MLALLLAALYTYKQLFNQDSGIVRLSTGDVLQFEGTASVAVATKAETELSRLVNRTRAQAGLPLLIVDPRLTALARSHSRDMYVSGYIGHVDVGGRDSFDRLISWHIRYTKAGENLAIGPSPAAVHEQMLASPSHRANLLDLDYCKVGIGVYRGAFGLIVTEVFTAWHVYGVPTSLRQCS